MSNYVQWKKNNGKTSSAHVTKDVNPAFTKCGQRVPKDATIIAPYATGIVDKGVMCSICRDRK